MQAYANFTFYICNFTFAARARLVDLRGVEPLTSTMRM